MSSEALRLADWLQGAVATYPQVSECEPGGYCSELDQRIDEAVALLRTQAARIAELEAEVERLRKPLTDEPLQVAAALRRLVVSHAQEFGDTFYFGYVANILEACPVCHGSGLDFDDDLKDCASCQGSGKRAIEAAKEAK